MDLKMLVIDPRTNRMSIQLQSKMVSGMDLLVQIVVLNLLTNPETDLLDPNDGGGLRELIGTNYDPDDLSELYTDISRRIAKTQSEIISRQIEVDTPTEERLRQIEIVSLTASQELGTVNLRLRIENEVGRTRDVVI